MTDDLVYITPRDWVDQKGVVIQKQRIITAAFGHTLLTLEQIKQAFTVLYVHELGNYTEAAKAFRVTDSTLYRWRQSWE